MPLAACADKFTMDSIIELDKAQLVHLAAFNAVPEYKGAAKPKHFMGVLSYLALVEHVHNSCE